MNVELGYVLVRGSGKKPGTAIVLTKGRRAQGEDALGAGGYLKGLAQANQRKKGPACTRLSGLRLPAKDRQRFTRPEQAERAEDRQRASARASGAQHGHARGLSGAGRAAG